MRVKKAFAASIIALVVAAGCTTPAPSINATDRPSIDDSVPVSASLEGDMPTESSRVTAVEAKPGSNGYSFAVTIESNDTGCDRYADWWEVITPEGELLYRRILAHSHVDEQPFTRSGGPVAVGEDDDVVVRSHTNPDGYSAQAMKGSVNEGFSSTVLPEDFAADLAEAEPQPSGCAF